jgi:hypothetical protein
MGDSNSLGGVDGNQRNCFLLGVGAALHLARRLVQVRSHVACECPEPTDVVGARHF